jgi:hypothetical protein
MRFASPPLSSIFTPQENNRYAFHPTERSDTESPPLSDKVERPPMPHHEHSFLDDDGHSNLVLLEFDRDAAVSTARRLRRELIKATTAEECRVLVDVALAHMGLSASFRSNFSDEDDDTTQEDLSSSQLKDDQEEEQFEVQDTALVSCLL